MCGVSEMYRSTVRVGPRGRRSVRAKKRRDDDVLAGRYASSLQAECTPQPSGRMEQPELRMGKHPLAEARVRLTKLWSCRRWVYAAYVLYGVLAIPSRTGFHLEPPACNLQLTSENFAASLTKVPHVVLFGCFFLLTVVQFDRIDRRAVGWSFAATVGMGVLIELQEGATRTGYCRMTDVAPDVWGALIAMAHVIAAVMIHRQWTSRRNRPVS